MILLLALSYLYAIGDDSHFHLPSTENYEGWEEVLDITVLLENNNLCVDNWEVSDESSYSDHKYITFSFNINKKIIKSYRNPRKTNWIEFDRLAREKLRLAPSPLVSSISEIEANLRVIETTLQNSMNRACPLRYSKKSFPPWWNSDLSRLRKETRRVFNSCYKSKSWKPYQDILKKYKSEIRRSKKQHGRVTARHWRV